MIIWLASYPRSGNTLLRTILKQCFDADSYADGFGMGPTAAETADRARHSPEELQTFGHVQFPGDWETFYLQATRSAETVLVKTHSRPRDSQRAIYVVRDGRAAISSYHAYHRTFLPEHQRTLLQLVIGDDAFGSWSHHYSSWCSESREVLVLKFEQLVRADVEILEKIRAFCGFEATPQTWSNPFPLLHERNPQFFRTGNAQFDPPHEWDANIDAIFWAIHGALMRDLGYGYSRLTLSHLESELLDIARHAVQFKLDFLAECHDKELEMRRQCEEIGKLRAICEERLAALLEKEREIGSLHTTCQERLDLINRLSAELARVKERSVL